MKRLLLSLALCSAAFLPAGADAGDVRGTVDGNFTLEIEGAYAGFLRSVAGVGYTRIVDGRVVAQGVPTSVTLRLGFGSRPILDWLAGSLAGNGPTKLRVVARNMELAALETYELADFTVEEVQIPPCDAGSRDAASVRVRGRPRGVTRSAGGGEVPNATVDKKVWLPANFRITVAGVDATQVNKLGAINVTRGPQGFEIAPFDVSMTEPTAGGWKEWADKTVVRGETDERTLKLDLLATDRTSVIATVELTRVSPVSLSYSGEPSEPHGDLVRRRTFTLAAKGITLTLPKKKKGGKMPPKG